MKTKLLKTLRCRYIIRWSRIQREWMIVDMNSSESDAMFHISFCVVLSEGLRGIYKKYKSDYLSNKFFQRTFAPIRRKNHRNKILKRK